MRRLLVILWLLASASTCLFAQQVGLDGFLSRVRDNHPFFDKERLRIDVQEAATRSELAGQEWRFSLGPSYQRLGEVSASEVGGERVDSVSVEAGASRRLWETGGNLSAGVSTSYSRVEPAAPVDPTETYTQRLSLSYVQPLLRNLGGALDRLGYDVARFNVSRVEAEIVENQESFLSEQALRFVDWAQLDEQIRIAQRRVDLAQEQLNQTTRRFNANLVDRVDVLRAEDAVRSAEQSVLQLRSQWSATRSELSVVAADPGLLEATPQMDIYERGEVPNIEEDTRALRSESRVTAPLRVALDQLSVRRRGLREQLKNELDLTLSASLAGQDEKAEESLDILNPDFTVALEYRFPSAKVGVRAGIEEIEAQARQISRELDSITVGLEASLRSLHIQIRDMERIMELAREQISSAERRTAEELQLYNQGRGQLTFVIQARDNEQNAQLQLLENAATYQKLLIRYRALTDRLL